MYNFKRDERPPYNGWARGDYECKCLGCDKSFIGDKRCLTCADCAYKQKQASSDNSDLLSSAADYIGALERTIKWLQYRGLRGFNAAPSDEELAGLKGRYQANRSFNKVTGR